MNKRKATNKKVLGVILAGGQSRRMGQNKAFLSFNNSNLINFCFDRLKKQNIPIIINANKDKDNYSLFQVPIIADDFYGKSHQKGPLSGILASLIYASKHGYDAIISVAVDTPFFPTNLVESFISYQTTNKAITIIAQSERGLQPTFGFWPISIGKELQEYLLTNTKCKIREFASSVNARTFTFKSEDGVDPFFNINTPDDLILANILLNKEFKHS